MSVNQPSAMYATDGVLPDGVLEEVEPGTNLLVSGPSMTGKHALALQLLARGASDGEGSMVVSTREPAGTICEEYEGMTGDPSHPYWVIDAVGSGESTDRSNVRTISSPGDLTGIGIEFSECAGQAADSGVDELRVGLDSLSPLLMYSDLQRAFRFLHVFTSQIQTRDWFGVFVLDPESHEERAVNTIRQLFDGMVELRMQDSGREVRVRGVTPSPTEWVPYE